MLSVWIILFLITAAHIFLLTKIFFFPYPELFVYSYLTKVGLVPYKQIFDQHFPGIMFFPVNLASLGVDTIFEARILHLGIIVIAHILLFLIGKTLLKSNLLALSGNLLYLVWQPFFEGYVLWIDLLVAPILLLSFLLLTNKKYFYSGLFIGIALLFKQVLVPLIFFVCLFLFVDNLRQGFSKSKHFLSFLLGLTTSVMLLVLWITNLKIWKEFVYWSLTFNLTTFAQMGRKYPNFHEIIKSLPIFGLGIFSLLFILRKKKSNFIILGLFFIGSLVFAYARFDFIHLQPALPFAILGIVTGLHILPSKIRKPLLILFITFSILIMVSFYKSNVGDKVEFFGEKEIKIKEAVLKYANPGDSVFAFGTTPHLYYLTKTHPPGNIFAFPFPWFTTIAQQEIYEGIITDPPVVVVRDKSSEVQEMNLTKYMPIVELYFEKYYKIIDVFDSTEIMVPN